MINYFKLNDSYNNGKIVKTEDSAQFIYDDGKWIKTTILLAYFNCDSDLYDSYEEITEEEANSILGL